MLSEDADGCRFGVRVAVDQACELASEPMRILTSRRQAEINHRLAAEQAKAAAEQQRKEGAWSKYFTPTQRCQIPESQRMADVCKANEAKLRARFEAKWAASERS